MRAEVHEAIAELEHSPPPIPAAELDEARALLQWMHDDHFTFLGYREYEIRTEGGEDVLASVEGTGLGILRDKDEQPHSLSFSQLTPEVRKLAREKTLLNLTKANSRATVHRPALSRLRRRQAVRRGGRGEVGAPLPRPLHPHRLQREPVGDPVAAAEGAERARALRPPARQPRPQGDDRDPRDVPAGRAVPDHRRRAARDRARHPPSRRAPPRPALRPPRRLRPLPLLSRLHPARAVQHREPAQDPGDPARGVRRRERRLHDAHLRVGAGPPALRRLHRARHGARLRRGGDRGAPRCGHPRVDGRSPRRARRPHRRRARRQRCTSATATSFPGAYRDDFTPRQAVHDLDRIERLASPDDLGLSLYAPLDSTVDQLAFKVVRAGRPILLSDVLPLLENMGVRVSDERPYELRPLGRDPVWIYDFGLQHDLGAELRVEELRETFQHAFEQVWRGEAENDGFNRLVLAARLTAREITILRAIAKYLRQAGSTFSQAYMEDALAEHPGRRPRPRRALHAPARPGAPRRCGRAGAQARRPARRDRRRRREPGRGQDPARLPQDRLGRAADELLPGGRGRAGEALPLAQARSEADPGSARASADVRGLRLLDPGRGGAPARRQGRPRRHPLVGPEGGLPHRGARPDEGAVGQERGDRAGGREGRLRRQAAAGRRRPRRPACGGRRVLPDLHARPARHHRHDRRPASSCRRATSSGTTRTTRTWSSRPTRARRRSRTSRTRSRRSTGSGSATRSPREGRPATTTRRWGSPPAAPGSRCGGTSASSGSTSRPPTSPRSGSATCPATCSGTGCCSPATSSSSAPSTTGTSSSTPIPTPSRASASASASSGCRARRGPTTTRR